ncbi:ISNCY family transposase [Spiroplasma endosymbiont of Nomada rufipes]|uniref:ISNCY family transposase n=1 Tax=Spiroplasma endosymbiont of Nomada rufipes TaxID=3077933 RepID=UPI00376F2B7D
MERSMTMKEKYKFNIINDIIINKLSKHQAKNKLNLTIRRINQLIQIFNREGKVGFIHKSRNKISNKTTNFEIKIKIINLYKTKYYNFNFQHFHEKLNNEEKIKISYSTLYTILIKEKITSPKRHKNKKNNLHPTRNRRTNFGELIQMDASNHHWFGKDKPKAFLHAAIDDATGNIVGLWFDHQETLDGYYNVFYQILTKYGIPKTFYTDNRTVFGYKKQIDAGKIKTENDTYTQYQKSCNDLGVEIIRTSIPQAKGRIERLFGTLQSRLISELRLNKIKNLEEANQFLKIYISIFNKQFALPIDNNKSAMIKAPNQEEINIYLSRFSKRKTDSGSTITYYGKKYFPYKNSKVQYIQPRTDVIVLKSFINELYLSYNHQIYELKEIAPKPIIKEELIKTKKVYIPNKNHPWRYGY